LNGYPGKKLSSILRLRPFLTGRKLNATHYEEAQRVIVSAAYW